MTKRGDSWIEDRLGARVFDWGFIGWARAGWLDTELGRGIKAIDAMATVAVFFLFFLVGLYVYGFFVDEWDTETYAVFFVKGLPRYYDNFVLQGETVFDKQGGSFKKAEGWLEKKGVVDNGNTIDLFLLFKMKAMVSDDGSVSVRAKTFGKSGAENVGWGVGGNGSLFFKNFVLENATMIGLYSQEPGELPIGMAYSPRVLSEQLVSNRSIEGVEIVEKQVLFKADNLEGFVVEKIRRELGLVVPAYHTFYATTTQDGVPLLLQNPKLFSAEFYAVVPCVLDGFFCWYGGENLAVGNVIGLELGELDVKAKVVAVQKK